MPSKQEEFKVGKLTNETVKKLHTLLYALAEEDCVIDGVDASELYIATFDALVTEKLNTGKSNE